MAADERVVVRKLHPDGDEAFRWVGHLLEGDEDGAVLVARFSGPPGDLGYLTLEHSDLFVEFYYFRRWFNVFQVYSNLGELKGWYCNVSTPATMSQGELLYTDLVLDVFVDPAGRYQVLDQEDYQRQSQHYSPDLATGAEAGLRALLELAAHGALPSRPFAAAAAALNGGGDPPSP